MQEDGSERGRSNYLDFDLEIGEGRGREYPVSVRSPAGDVHENMHFPFDKLALDLRLRDLQIALLRSGGKHRRVPSEEEQAVQDLGRALFDALFSGEVRTCFEMSLREAAQQDQGLRLKLRVRPPKLNALPWEFLYDSRQAEYVCLSRQTPIVRYLESHRPIQPLKVTPPLCILGMVASPTNLPALDVEREKERVERATADLRAQGLVELTWLPGQTWRDLQEATWGGPWHVFHFIGHGGFDAHADEGFIALANRAGEANSLSATRLGRLLADHKALRLVLLNSCEGAKGSEHDLFSSTASILVRRGIPAVLAMQYEITDLAAVEMARAFYRALAHGMAVDEAVVVARKAISIAVTNTVEWGTPVLYMRTPDGVLFEMTEMPRVTPPPPEGPTVSPEVEAEQERRLEQLYLDGLDAFWIEEWDKAVRCFGAITDQRPDYQDAGVRLQEAKRQRDLARLYTQAQAAQEAGNWPDALSTLEKLVAEQPDFKDAAALLEAARKKVQLADLYVQAQRLLQAQRWQAVLNIFAQIRALDPDYPDPDGLLAVAQREMDEEQRQAEMQDRYRRAGQAVDAGEWEEARRLLRQVQEQEPGYRETERLLARVEAEIERQQQVARLYDEAQSLARAGQWRQALARLEEIRTLDPQFADPKGIIAKAQAGVDREEEEARRQEEAAALYADAVRLLRAGQYEAALETWDQVRALDPQHPDRDKVRATAQQRLAAMDQAASPERDTSQDAQPRRAPLPRWLWPAVGGVAVVVIVVVVIAALGGAGGEDGTRTSIPTATQTLIGAATTPSDQVAAPTHTAMPAQPTTPAQMAPAPTATYVYEVKAGDTLFSIARQFNVTTDALIQANGLTGTNLTVGQGLIIPQAAAEHPYDDKDPTGATVLFWLDYTEIESHEEALLEMVDEFNATNEWGIEVSAEYSSDYGENYNKMLAAIAAEDSTLMPQLTEGTAVRFGKYMLADALVDLGEFVDSPKWGLTEQEQADFFPGIFEADVSPQFGDGHYRMGFPSDRLMRVVYYNQEWLNVLGYDGPPTTWAKLEEMACAATDPGAGTVGLAVEPSAGLMASMIFSRHGTYFEEDGSAFTFTNDTVKETMWFIKELYDEGCYARPTIQYTEIIDFSTYKTLFTIGPSSVEPLFHLGSDYREFPWGVAPLPYMDGGDEPVQNVYGTSLAVPKTTPEQELAAWLFVKWLTAAEQQARWARATGYLPVRQSVAAEMTDYFEAHPAYKTAFDLLPYSTCGAMWCPCYGEVSALMTDAFSAILDGADIDETLSRLEADANVSLEANMPGVVVPETP